MATIAPIKVDAETDRLISHAAHFLGASKKSIVDEAVRDYIEAHREEIGRAALAALKELDGTNASVVSLLSGFSQQELDELGGVPEA